MNDPLSGVWTGFLVITATGVMVLGVQVYRQVEVNTSAHDALCALRASEQASYAATAKFLKEHPEGIPGIPVALFKQSQARQKATLKSLSELDCN